MTVWFNLVLFVASSVNEIAKIIPVSPVFIADVALMANLVLRFRTTMGIEMPTPTE